MIAGLRPRRLVRSFAAVAAASLLLGAGRAPAAGQAPLGVETFDAVWQIVRDSHFDPRMNGLDWDALAKEFRPAAAAARTPGELRAVLRDLLGQLGQSHFTVLPASADAPRGRVEDLSGTPGFDVRLIGRDLFVTGTDPDGAAAAAGVRTGWKVVAIDGEPVDRLLGDVVETLPARLLQVEGWRAAQTRLRGPAGTAVDVRFADGADRSIRLSVPRRPETGHPVTVGHLPTMFVRVGSERVVTPGGRSVGVIRFNVWMTAVDRMFQHAIDEFRGANGIVIDVRGNPGGLAAMLMGISGHFIRERTALGVMKTRDNELRFHANPRRVSLAGEAVEPYAGPVAILVDALSGSTTECFAGGMQSLGRARVVGQPTMGQTLPALFTRLPNGDVLIHAYGDFVTADGTRLEGRGVIPDDVVPLERGDLLAGRDRTMEAALAWIDAESTAERGR